MFNDYTRVNRGKMDNKNNSTAIIMCTASLVDQSRDAETRDDKN